MTEHCARASPTLTRTRCDKYATGAARERRPRRTGRLACGRLGCELLGPRRRSERRYKSDAEDWGCWRWEPCWQSRGTRRINSCAPRKEQGVVPTRYAKKTKGLAAAGHLTGTKRGKDERLRHVNEEAPREPGTTPRMFSRATSRAKSKREVAVDITGLLEDAAGNLVHSAREEAEPDSLGTPPEKQRMMSELHGPMPMKVSSNATRPTYASGLLVLVLLAAVLFVADFAGDKPSGGVRIPETRGLENTWKARQALVDNDETAVDDDELAFLGDEEETREEAARLAGIPQPHVYVPPVDEQDETLIAAKPCVLWEDFDSGFCAPRLSAYRDLHQISRNMMRLDVPDERIGVYLDEHAIRLRSSYVAKGEKDTFSFAKSQRANCMTAQDSSILGGLMAAIIEELPPSRNGRLRQNVNSKYSRASRQCCHRICAVMNRLSVGGFAAYDSCCMKAPSKCASFYPVLE
ncbi:hypothetical protein FVE85_3247 [Porphyridium purpureum]|uniref:Uncharacterized protein n=1 Tax=Porphyridium purpureum TaxID=35688 RepID=A0A5J4YUH8_PORPP|nr:hypothetical protein FVE85_3247 [Porphyridium purpureum]|eukprot:POR6350..scf227_4